MRVLLVHTVILQKIHNENKNYKLLYNGSKLYSHFSHHHDAFVSKSGTAGAALSARLVTFSTFSGSKLYSHLSHHHDAFVSKKVRRVLLYRRD